MKKFIICFGMVILLAGCGNVVVEEIVEDVAEESEEVEEVVDAVEEAVEESEEAVELEEEGAVLEAEEITWITYSGAFFDVDYPSTFTVTEEENDYAAFASADGEVVFALYSPLWFGDAGLIYPQAGETITDEKREENFMEESVLGGPATQKLVWITMKADDGSYTRSIFDNQLHAEEGSQVRKTLSFQYKNSDSYDKHRTEYLHFRDSVVQYAD